MLEIKNLSVCGKQQIPLVPGGGAYPRRIHDNRARQ